MFLKYSLKTTCFVMVVTFANREIRHDGNEQHFYLLRAHAQSQDIKLYRMHFSNMGVNSRSGLFELCRLKMQYLYWGNVL